MEQGQGRSPPASLFPFSSLFPAYFQLCSVLPPWLSLQGNGELLAFLVGTLTKSNLHIGKIAVREDCRRMGMGRALLQVRNAHLVHCLCQTWSNLGAGDPALAWAQGGISIGLLALI